jgi:hypothetical protein
MARPVSKQFQRFGLASLHQRIRPVGVSPGQDGESRVPVLINPSACDRHIRYQVAGTPVRLSGHLVSTAHRHRQLPAPVSAAGQSQSHGFHRGSIVGAAVAKHCPHDAGQLVGQRNDDLVLVMRPRLMGPTGLILGTSGSCRWVCGRSGTSQEGAQLLPSAGWRRSSDLCFSCA